MLKTEKLLKICADSMKMPGWNDALSMMTEKNAAFALSDELLENVAGGRTNDDPSDHTLYE